MARMRSVFRTAMFASIVLALVLVGCAPSAAPTEAPSAGEPITDTPGRFPTEPGEAEATEAVEETEAPTEEPADGGVTQPTPSLAGNVEVEVQRLAGAPTDPGAAMVVDALGRQSFFRTSEVIFDTAQAQSGELNRFLERYGGTLIDDGGLPTAGTLVNPSTARSIPAFSYRLIRIDPTTATLNTTATNLTSLGMRGSLTFSSEGGQRLMAIVAEAQVGGYPVMPNFSFDVAGSIPMSGTDEGAVSGSTVDAFALGYNQLTHMPRAWQLTEVLGVTRRVRVAVIDSGFALGMDDYDNPDFPDPTDVPQWDISDDDEDVSGPSEAQAWHGTQVAGIAAAHMNNAYGTAGTGAQVIDLVLIRVGDEDGRMSWYDVAKAIHQAVGLGAEVINLSMAGTCDGLCQTLGAFSGLNATKEAIDLAYENNVVVISAAGNGGADTVGDNLSTVTVLPCAYDHVICIGALAGTASNGTYTASKKRASYSNYGTTVDLWVPGSLHCTVLPGSTEARMCQGTSAAAPYAAGIAALMKAANSSLTTDQVAALLRQSAQKGGEDSEVDRAGIVNAYAAVLAATGGKLPADRYEPNEDRTRAANLVLGTSGATVQGCTISTATDVDAYTFELATERTINISAQYVQSFGDLQIELQDVNGRVLYQGTFSGHASSGLAYDQKFISASLTAGRYTLIVRGVSSSLAAYDLAIR